jgi:hypothetical protein
LRYGATGSAKGLEIGRTRPGNFLAALERSFFELTALAAVALINNAPAINAAVATLFGRKQRP